MNLLALLRVALRALAVNKLRSLLTMLGIIIGVGAVIVMIAVGSGAQARVEEQIRSLGSNLLLILSGATTSGGVRMGFGSNLTLTEDDAAAIPREIPEVMAAPALRGSAQIVWGNQNWSTIIFGVTPEYLEVRQWEIAAGRSFDATDMAGAAKVCLVGQTVARQLFGGVDPVGQSIRVRRVPFTVIGVLVGKGQSMMGSDQDDLVIMPISTARKRVLGAANLAKQRSVGTIWVKVPEGNDMKAAEEQVRGLLRQRHRLQPGQDDDFSLRNLEEVAAAQEASSRVLALLLAAVASVSLVVGGIGIMNIMLVSVTERTREIGLRRAVGARTRDILGQFLVEAVTLSLIGGLAGILLGVGAAYAIAQFAGWRIVLSPDAVILAVAFAFAIGVFFGFYPARKAAYLNPVEALRFE
ncbi:MAG: multidrug ABC transporter substrate-binding protein [Betaproteobacteria bacterium RIFCSPLOWO2_02_67_12]|nr:MAG: multidrug ABC transporter substrate-binding protein [Betaproteobacteria bacterium RIFCSPLOWO2_02_67_12]OGA27433.1 MAG: multidrug ABC transporter substrate-binding protein [Betaproteobacteria bacterium RIFCSPLOWO2_02_FULL_68_150]OGA72410.1 MAG: multidrug ABC transporter substrate-binding protein [Betaproteobacteria bacterium RIFCSPLOWO2_12_FULL_67_28]